MSSENIPGEQAGKPPEAPSEIHRPVDVEPQAQSNLDAFNWNAIAQALSEERLSKYLARAVKNTRQALQLYVWNQEVGAALTPTLCSLEVCLRNGIASALADAYGRNWVRTPSFRYGHEAIQIELSKAEDRTKKAVPSTPDIIAASDFNLWRELCKPAYAGVFWGKRLPMAFPHIALPGKEREVLFEIHRRVDLLLKLRNRIAHHEPIIGSNWEPIGVKLKDRHRDAAEILRWMSPEVAAWVADRDQFWAAMRNLPEGIP